jgi:hypothetical protein
MISVNIDKFLDKSNVVQWAKEKFLEEDEVEVVVVARKKPCAMIHQWEGKHTFTKLEADIAFGKYTGNRKELEAFCQTRLLPLNVDWDGIQILKPNLDYIQVQGTNAFERVMDDAQLDKSWAVVVAGESGSGKSVFSCLEVKHRKYLPVYMLLQLTEKEKSNEIEVKNDTDVSIDVSEEFAEKPASEFEALHKLLKGKLVKLDSAKHQNIIGALCELKKKINVSRNKWATKVFESALEKFVSGSEDAETWMNNKWSDNMLPEKVAIIIDEVTDVDLVEGLIENVREMMSKYKYLAKKSLLFVFVGTGLDAIRYPERVGTNPNLSKLVTLKGPNLDNLKNTTAISKIVYDAINSGVYSRVLKSNSRMLFRCLLPIFALEIFSRDGKYSREKTHTRFEQRLKEVASFRPIMDYGARYYVSQNTVGDMSGEKRDDVLAASFLYHLSTAIENPRKKSKNRSEVVKKIQERELHIVKVLQKELQNKRKATEKDAFRVGLAAESGTSSALKYLACFGLSCELRHGFGNEFEELTALHYLRLMDIQGHTVKRFTLSHAWPPKSNKKNVNITEADITRLKDEVLQPQKQTELMGLTFPSEGKHCYIFSQGTATAQGGDVLVLVMDFESNVFELETIQCKHFKKSPGPETILPWWSSLGIALHDDGKWNVEPMAGSAGHSFAGMRAFRDLLRDRTQFPIKLGKRTLAVSFPMPPSATIKFPVPSDECARVLFREMLEPTISTFELRTAQTVDSYGKE